MKHEPREVDYRVLKISSPAFEAHCRIPSKYSCEGENISPPVDIREIPEEASCLAIIAEDPDSPSGTWTHWIAWDIPATHHLPENIHAAGTGLNSFGKTGYGGPCPPPGRPHRYQFKIYALDQPLGLPDRAGRRQLEKAMSGHILAYGELEGIYNR